MQSHCTKFTLDYAQQLGKPIKIVNYITNEITKTEAIWKDFHFINLCASDYVSNGTAKNELPRAAIRLQSDNIQAENGFTRNNYGR